MPFVWEKKKSWIKKKTVIKMRYILIQWLEQVVNSQSKILNGNKRSATRFILLKWKEKNESKSIHRLHKLFYNIYAIQKLSTKEFFISFTWNLNISFFILYLVTSWLFSLCCALHNWILFYFIFLFESYIHTV